MLTRLVSLGFLAAITLASGSVQGQDTCMTDTTSSISPVTFSDTLTTTNIERAVSTPTGNVIASGDRCSCIGARSSTYECKCGRSDGSSFTRKGVCWEKKVLNQNRYCEKRCESCFNICNDRRNTSCQD